MVRIGGPRQRWEGVSAPRLVTTQERNGTAEGNHNEMKTQHMLSSAEPPKGLLLGNHSLLAYVTRTGSSCSSGMS